MVSNDAEVLITDFGFATVGRFGPPPLPSTQEPESVPSMANIAGAANITSDGVPEMAGVDVAQKRARDDIDASTRSQTVTAAANGGGKGSTRSPELVTGGGEENNAPHTTAIYDVMSSKSRPQAKHSGSSFVPAAEPAHVQRSCPAAGAQVAPAAPLTRAQLATTADSTGSPPKGVGKDRRDQAGKETGDGEGAQGPARNMGEIGRPPNRDRVLYGTIKGYTPRYQSPEVNVIMEKKWKAAAQAGDRPPQIQAPQVGLLRLHA